MVKPLGVSVVTLNGGRNAKWLEECKRSIMEQSTMYPIEHIVIDNSNRKFTIAMGYNEGVNNAKYRYFYILDDDDECHIDCMETLVSTMLYQKALNPKTYRVACHTLIMDENGEALGTSEISNQGLMDTDMVLSLGGYPDVPWEAYSSSLVIHADSQLNIVATQKGLSQTIISATLHAWRIHDKQASAIVNQEMYHRLKVTGKLEDTRFGKAVDLSKDNNLERFTRAMNYQRTWDWHNLSINEDTVTILCITYNSMDTIKKYVSCLNKYTKPVSFVAIDNASTDGTPEFLEKAGLSVVRNKENIGFGPALNQGFEQIDTKYIVIMNPDIYVTPLWLETLVAAIERHEDARAGIASCKYVHPNGTVLHEGAALNKDMIPIYIRGMKWSTPEHEYDAQMVSFACAILTKEIYKRFRFDIGYGRGYYEDSDFNMQVRDAGYTVWYTPYVTVVHDEHGAWKNKKEEMNELCEKNSKFFIQKWKGHRLMEDGYEYMAERV